MLLFYANISPVSCCVQQFQNFKVKNKGSDGVYLHSGSTHDQMITLLFIERDLARPYDQKVWFLNSSESIGIHENDTKSRNILSAPKISCHERFSHLKLTFELFHLTRKMLVFNWSTADESFSSSLARIFSFSKIKKNRTYRVRHRQSQEIFGIVPG